MTCKNCNNNLRTDYSFCPDCGAKVIRKRITVKSLIFDFFERYFNLDNTLLATLKDIIIKPQAVCGGYISGLRKKYLDPVSLLAISLTLSGIIMFLMKKVAWKYIDFGAIGYAQTSSGGAGTQKIMEATMEYSSFIYFFYIPIIACSSFVVFNKKQYNFPEHAVIATYSLTCFSIITTVYAFFALLISPQFYIDTAVLYIVIMIGFCLYVSYKNSGDTKKSLVWRIPVFLFLVFIGYIGISVLTLGLLFITGDLSVQDFIPKN
ncbi:hypothetical protein PK35_15095 [Tamlana nanhaiensis]|uniref:DUF3667 domain-containing protein n=1 Tax=Neotamlana nanhaiensis TaxID=1382798 RepID=A0A0D7VX63_9FLAO|nr:DUF3667 domain-containing protein [Tamlana nanhaiensis]KJD31431.1 hypothetical protein PK35_15095 [Tamlana nanhaiensis]